MRKTAGWAVLVLGTAGLGWWAHGHQADRIEEQITNAAREVALGSVHGVEAHVSGRDITLHGLADSVAEQNKLVQALHDIPGRRVVHADALTILPTASPYVFEAAKTADGGVSAKGFVPTATASAVLANVVPSATLDMANGAPDGWTDSVAAGMSALAPLAEGSLKVSDQNLELTGVAQSGLELTAAEAALEALPEGFTATSDVTLIDDGQSADYDMVFDATSGLNVSGRAPAGSSGASLGWALGAADVKDGAEEDVAPEAVAAVDMAQNNALIAAIAPQMKAIERFDLAVKGAAPSGEDIAPINAELTIETRPDADAAAVEAAIRDALPADIRQGIVIKAGPVGPLEASETMRDNQVSGLREYLVDGRWVGAKTPYEFAASKGDEGVSSVTGDVPSAEARTELSTVLGAQADALNAAYGAPQGWAAAVISGLNALEVTQSGTLSILDQDISISGTVATPVQEAAIDDALANLPEGFALSKNITVLDDGQPSDFSVSYSASEGARADGRMPQVLSALDMADALGLASVEDNTELDSTPDGASEQKAQAIAALSALRPWLPQVERFQADFEGADQGRAAQARFDIDLVSGSDGELVGAALQDSMGDAVALDLEVVASSEGDGVRVNAATGAEEQLLNGYWLPLRSFDATSEECTNQANTVLAEFKIGFVSGGSRLNGEAARSVNELAAVVGPCLDAGLSAELGGHTDSTGSEELNQKLSQERADAVRAALIARGMNGDALTAKGYGPAQPIADNGTEEGRAANRRTEIIWSDPAAAAQVTGAASEGEASTDAEAEAPASDANAADNN